MMRSLEWIDQRTGLPSAVTDWLHRPIDGGPAWRFVWPSTIVFTFITEIVTGLALWMYYSPGAQSSWESVYYIQHRVQAGWLLRAIHHYAAQATLVLAVLYLMQMIVRRAYRPPREALFWTVLLIVLVTLGLNLTGDLLAWDQNSYWGTRVRTGFLYLMPGLGGSLYKLAVGGAELGSLTLTRFLSLHIGVFSVAMAALLILHARLARRHGMEEPRFEGSVVTYWPGQALRDMVACVFVLGVIVALSAQHGVSGPRAGVELGAAANPTEDPGTARPEWSFRGLYRLNELFPSSMSILAIFVLPGIATMIVFAMPFIGRTVVGHQFNLAFTIFISGGLAFLAWQAYSADASNSKYIAATQAGRQQAQRVKELADSPSGIPVGGALTLLANDPKTQGPRLFQQHCASCHAYSDDSGSVRSPAHPTAADLRGFAGREWIRGYMTPDGIRSEKYFGNTKFKNGKMAAYLKEAANDADPKENEATVVALSAEAGLKSQIDIDARDAPQVAQGRELIATDCAACHTFHGKGTASGPDLTDYGSRDWIIGLMRNPAHPRFYGKENDRMPAFAESSAATNANILTERELGLLADWIRGDWYEPKPSE